MNDNTINTNNQLIFLGAALAAPNGQFAIKKAAIVGYHAYFMCPKCGRPVMLMPEKEGFNTFPCKHCETAVIVKCVTIDKIKPKQPQTTEKQEQQSVSPATEVKDQKRPENQQTEPQPAPKPKTERIGGRAKVKVNARIVWGGLISRKSYNLREGDNWIGRWNAEEPSDIMVKDDFMSRRSAVVNVIRQNNEYLFKFTVKRATNSVKVNGKIIEEEQAIYLNYEDRIEMGNTTLFVKKAKS